MDSERAVNQLILSLIESLRLSAACVPVVSQLKSGFDVMVKGNVTGYNFYVVCLSFLSNQGSLFTMEKWLSIYVPLRVQIYSGLAE